MCSDGMSGNSSTNTNPAWVWTGTGLNGPAAELGLSLDAPRPTGTQRRTRSRRTNTGWARYCPRGLDGPQTDDQGPGPGPTVDHHTRPHSWTPQRDHRGPVTPELSCLLWPHEACAEPDQMRLAPPSVSPKHFTKQTHSTAHSVPSAPIPLHQKHDMEELKATTGNPRKTDGSPDRGGPKRTGSRLARVCLDPVFPWCRNRKRAESK